MSDTAPTEFAVGYRNEKNWGGPFAPMSEDEARRILPDLKARWDDATLLTRVDAGPWTEVIDGEGKSG